MNRGITSHKGKEITIYNRNITFLKPYITLCIL